MSRLTTAINHLSVLGKVFKSVHVVGERLECATRECSQICELVQRIREHKDQYESLALRIAQLLAAVEVAFKNLGLDPPQPTLEANVDHLRVVLSEVNSVVKDRASHQHKRKRITDALFHHDFNPLCRLHHDKADIPRLHRRVDEAVERFQVALLMRPEAVLARAGFNIAFGLRLGGEEQRVDATIGTGSATSPAFDARKTFRAAVIAIIAIEHMSLRLDYRVWLSQDKAFEHEHTPDASHTISPPSWSAEGLRGQDISLPAHEYVLSKYLVPHLEALMCDGVGVQTAVDILDRALLNSNPSHPAYGQGVRRLRRWCRKFALLPTSFQPISIRTIQLAPERPRYSTALSDIFYGAHKGTGVAVKVLRVLTTEHSLADDQKSFRNEVVTWRYLRHPNIVPFLGVCDKSPLCLVSHWMEEGTLLDFFQKYPTERRTSYILGTIRGLAFMHSLGVVHGDIKAINILVDRKRCAQLADFGLASVLSTATTAITNGADASGKGTIRYIAPELYLDTSSVRTDRSDIYALSLTIWETFTLNLPFSHIRDTFALFMRVAKGGERPVKPTGCEKVGLTDGLWDMMQRGWAPKPELRPCLSAFIEVLEARA